ncbi:hypothetical protein CRENBAI_015014 [Crenichthys baileyi]|uniref:Uncharacterized protein n=1 Tax=Crenichthys baileyi TaxID=28760 RepID=A0AAV9SRA5_9TELE
MLGLVPPIGRSASLGVYGAASAAAKRDESLDKCWALSRPSDAQRLWGSMGQPRLQRNETSHWINAGLCPAHRTLSVSGGLWGSGLASAGPDAQLLHDDWMIFLRLNPFLIDSEMSESAILKLSFPSLKDQHPPLIPKYSGVNCETLLPSFTAAHLHPLQERCCSPAHVRSPEPVPERFVLVLASEPRDKGFEEEAPPDPDSEGFKEQLVLVLASEGPADSASVSEGPVGAASASEGTPGSASGYEGSPDSKPGSKPDSKPDSKPPEFHQVSGGSSTLLGRPPDRHFLRCRPPRSLRLCWPPCLRLRRWPPRPLHLCRPPRLRRRPPRTLCCRFWRPPELCACPDELEERLRFFARQIKSFRRTSLVNSSPEFREKIRQMEEDYETEIRQFYCRLPPSSPRALLQSSPRQVFRALLQSSPRQVFRALTMGRRPGRPPELCILVFVSGPPAETPSACPVWVVFGFCLDSCGRLVYALEWGFCHDL